jgi:uncharacterized membrane protein YvlD (DUF360 family)
MNQLFSLQVKDFVKGLFVAVFSAVVTFLYAAIQSPDFSFSTMDWDSVVLVASSSMLGYLLKQFVSEAAPEPRLEKVAGITLEDKPAPKRRR